MSYNKTFGNLKKRIFDALDDYSESGTCYVTDTNRDILTSRLPDAVTSSLVRMYESLAVCMGRCTSKLYRPRLLFDAGFIGKDGAEADFDVSELALCFGFYGSGSLVIYDENGNAECTFVCEGDGIKSFKRELAALDRAGHYFIKPTENLEISCIAVYENDGLTDASLIPCPGNISFQLPDDFESLVSVENSERYVPRIKVQSDAQTAEIQERLLCGKNEICIEYKKRVPDIQNVSDDFVLDLTDLAFEALVCLAASEVCREEESDLYTRLLYKYTDLCEGLYSRGGVGAYRSNSFFKSYKRMR